MQFSTVSPSDLCGRGSHERAIGHARRRLALDPLNEAAHRRLIELYGASGERAAALAQYRECVRTLHRELGVAPTEETTALYRAVREGSAGPAVEQALGVHETAARDYPLVGRDAQWNALRAAYDAVGPDGKLVVLAGETGIGKTRLAGDFIAWARDRGSCVATSRGVEGEAELAFGCAIELLRSALAANAGPIDAAAAGEASRLLPELGTPPTPTLDGPGAQARFLDGVARVLFEATSGSKVGLILVDDVHWADASSLEVLAFLARRLQGRPVLLLLSWRPEETPADHPARQILADATHDGLGATIELDRLDRERVAELVTVAEAPAELSNRLFEETQGVPFFVVEYLDAQSDAGSDWPLPPGVRGLLEARLNASSEVASQVVAAAAVLGRQFDSDLIRAVSGRSEEETVGALEELTRRGILTETESAEHAFRHELARRVAYDRTSAGRRRLLHRRAAEALGQRELLRCPRGRGRPASRGSRVAMRREPVVQACRSARPRPLRQLRGARVFREVLALATATPGRADEQMGTMSCRALAGDYAAALDATGRGGSCRDRTGSRRRTPSRPRPSAPRRVGTANSSSTRHLRRRPTSDGPAGGIVADRSLNVAPAVGATASRGLAQQALELADGGR